MSDRVNPYIAGAPVTDPTMFFGREDVFTWIEQNIAGRYAENALVTHGQRRVGKTSVLKQLDHRLADRYVPVFFDFQGRTHTTLDQFLWRLAREITRVLRTRYGLELPKPEQDDFSRDPEHFAGPFLSQVHQALGDRNLLLVFDEFDTLQEPISQEMLARDLIPHFSRLLHGAERLNFIFSIGSSGHKLEHMQADYTDFFRAALYKKISFLEPEDAHRLIVDPVRDIITYDSAAVDRILSLTSGHPYFTQLTCHELFALCQQSNRWHVGPAEVESVLPDVIERGTVNLKFVWDDASDAERYTLAALGYLGRSATKDEIHAALHQHKVRVSEEEISAALLNLNVKDVLAGEHNFTVDLLRLWLQHNRPIERVVEELAEKHPIAVRFTQIAEEYQEQGLAERALENYHSALEATPDYLPALLGTAEIHHETGRWEDAVAAYQAVLQLDDENIQARVGLCESYLGLGDAAKKSSDLPGAQNHYQQVLEIHAEHAEARERLAALQLERAKILAAQKQWHKAGEAITRAWATIPDDLEIAARRAAANAAPPQGPQQLEEALAPLHRALAIMRKGLAQEMVARAGQLRERKRFGAAIVSLQHALAYAPGDAEIEEEIKAVQEAERAGGTGKMLVLAEQALRTERWEEAIGILQRFLALEPENTESAEKARALVAQAHQQQASAGMYAAARQALDGGKYRQAAGLFEQVLGQQTGYRDAAELRDKAATLQRRRQRRNILLAGLAGVGVILLVGLTWWLTRPDSPLMAALATATPTPTAAPSPTPTPTPIPLMAWRQLYNGEIFPNDETMAVAVDPRDSNVIYIGNGKSGIYKSHDGGKSWQPAQAGVGCAQIYALVIDPQDPQTLYASSNEGGLYKTSDGGLTWQLTTNGMEGSFTIVGLDPQDSQHLYLVSEAELFSSDRDILYESRDGAASWEIRAEFDSILGMAVDPEDGNRIYMLGVEDSDISYENRVYRSDGPGAEWKQVWQRRSEEEEDGSTLATAAESPPTLYLSDGESLYRSRDGGGSWESAGDAPCMHLMVNPYDPRALYCWISYSDVNISYDGGQSWEDHWTGIVNDVAFAPDAETVYISGPWGVALVSGREEDMDIAILGDSMINPHVEIHVDPLDGAILYATEEDSYPPHSLYRSSDGGNTWEELAAPESSQDLILDPNSGALYRFDGYGQEIYRSRDRGETWTTITLPEAGLYGLGVHPRDSDRLYALYGYYTAPYLSTDGGQTWEQSAAEWPGGERLYFGYEQEPIMYLVDPNTQDAASSIDGGQHWADCGESNWRLVNLAVDPANGERVFAATAGGGVLVSEDGCRFWEPHTDGLTSLFVNAIVFHPHNPNLIYAGTDGGAYLSRDGGETWEAGDSGLLGGTVVYSLALDPNNPANVYASTPLGIFKLEVP